MDKYAVLLSEVRQTFAGVVWAHKTQEKQADFYICIYTWIKGVNIFCAACTSCGLVAILNNVDNFRVKFFTVILSLVSVTTTSILAAFDFTDQAKLNKMCANKLVCVRNELLHTITNLTIKNQSIMEIEKEYRIILNELHEIYKNAPHTTNIAVKIATRSLRDKEYSYTDEEIDEFLPDSLKSKNKDQTK